MSTCRFEERLVERPFFSEPEREETEKDEERREPLDHRVCPRLASFSGREREVDAEGGLSEGGPKRKVSECND